MKLLAAVGMVALVLVGCGGDASTPDGGDPRCPFSSTSGVMSSLYDTDAQRCAYFCASQLDDAGRPRAVLYCGGRCLPVDTVEHCGNCTRTCSGSTPYCDLSTTEACVSTPPR